MTEAKSPSKTWLLRAWLYGVPLTFLSIPAILIWIVVSPSSIFHYFLPAMFVATKVFTIFQAKGLEQSEGNSALPTKDDLGQFCVLLAIIFFALLICRGNIARMMSCMGLFMLMGFMPVRYGISQALKNAEERQ